MLVVNEPVPKASPAYLGGRPLRGLDLTTGSWYQGHAPAETHSIKAPTWPLGAVLPTPQRRNSVIPSLGSERGKADRCLLYGLLSALITPSPHVSVAVHCWPWLSLPFTYPDCRRRKMKRSASVTEVIRAPVCLPDLPWRHLVRCHCRCTRRSRSLQRGGGRARAGSASARSSRVALASRRCS